MIVTLTGPSGAGKSTLERELTRIGCKNAISHTTRPRRAGENHGEHYHFVTLNSFDAMQAAGDFVETIDFGTRRYGLSKQALTDAPKQSRLGIVVVVAEPTGAAQIRAHAYAHCLPAMSVWIDCGAATQAERFVNRLCTDMVIGDARSVYAERLTLMMTTEVGWRSDAQHWCLSPGINYNMKLDGRKPVDDLALDVLAQVTLMQKKAA